jgi:hypothetical protein
MMREWTPQTLKEYVDAVLLERDHASKAALGAANQRLDGMNEFRRSLDDAQKTYITRNEVYALVLVAAALGAIAGHFVR